LSKNDKSDLNSARIPASAADIDSALQWFAQSAMHHKDWVRSLVLPDFTPQNDATMRTAVNTLRAAGFTVTEISGPELFRQADYLWDLAIKNATFGRPVASKVELDIGGADFLFVSHTEAPESPHHLWYLFHYVVYARALAGKPSVFTTALGLDEFIVYGAGCEDLEYIGRKITWEKLVWFLQASAVDLQLFCQLKQEGLPIMLATEYSLFKALVERNLKPIAQHTLGQYVLDIAMIDKEHKLDIECDLFHRIDASASQAQTAKKNLVLVSDGWQVLRFTASEVLSNVNACADAVEEVWQQGRKKSAFGRLISGQSSPVIAELPIDDDTQRLVIAYGAGPAAVVGGAGTGKTSCAIHRVAFLIAQGVNPERILVVSYTGETIKHFKTELEKLAEKQNAQKVNCYTWHDLGLKILKENLTAIKRKLPLKTESNPQKVIQRLLAKYKKELDPATLELSEELDEFAVAELISLYKANLVTSRYVRDKGKGNIDELVAKVFQAYEDQLQKSNKIDKDDQVTLAAQLLADNQEVRARYQYQYDHVIVDEYQDATAAGDLLVRLLAYPQDGLFFFGDEDEAIYETKGGLPRLMAEMSIRLPNARCFTVEQNWRSHPAIIEHACQLTAQLGRRRIVKTMRSGWGSAPQSAIVGPLRFESERAEANWVADEVGLLLDTGRKPEDIAILYRYHRFALIIEEALSRKGIRCLASHPETGLVPDEVGDAMAFLRLVMDPDGPKARESFERICQLRENAVDPKLSTDIARFAEMNNLSYLKAIEIYSEASAKSSLHEIEELVRTIRNINYQKLTPAESIAFLKRSQRLGDYYKSQKVPPGVNYEPLRALTELEEEARQYKTVAEFVKSHVSSRQGGAADAAPAAVSVLTVHESKGKEFPVVFLVCLADGLFPSNSSNDEEEERRLFYVAMTRAREVLYLSFPDEFSKTTLQPSPFLAEAGLPFIPPPEDLNVAPPLQTAPQQEVALPPSMQAGGAPLAVPSPPNLSQNLSSPNVPPTNLTAPVYAAPPSPAHAQAAGPTEAERPVPFRSGAEESALVPVMPPPPATMLPGQAAAVTGEIRTPAAALPDTTNDADKILNQAQDKLADGPEQGTKLKSLDELLNDVQPSAEAEIVSPLHAAEGVLLLGTASGALNPVPSDEAQRSLQSEPVSAANVSPPPNEPSNQAAIVNYIEQHPNDYWKQIETQPSLIPQQSGPPTFAPKPGDQLPVAGAGPNYPGGNGGNTGSYPAQSQSGPQTAAQIPPGSIPVWCSSCGSAIEFGSRFCGECGALSHTSAAPQLRSCRLCGAPLDGDAKFCGECGSVQHDVNAHAQQAQAAGHTQYAQPPGFPGGAPTQRGWVVKLLKFLED
jgi:DNA helicase-2/ATP-dependent DNA helicase PcrA